MNRYCIVIPNYNHTHAIAGVLSELGELSLPIIMIDDGSDEDAKKVFTSLAQTYSFLTLLTHSENQGKGGAVQTGLRYAFANGYSHAIQVDADGQHSLHDISKLIAASDKTPENVVSGCPIYDSSVPKHRYLSRYITHFWVWVETLSFDIVDSMCGFRVYPLQQTEQLMNKRALGARMDFDIEILVRLYWQGARVTFIPTQVIYPEGGVSHFRALHDNLGISWLHTRLFFGMLVRIPKLLLRKVAF
ncbi:glycosyltransferase family 2 protein [Pseudoalteromonas arctica]|uniref:Glycosyltransferase family 2 protein n=1 Tax=Pseudoalteromonas arctica TaxID=394751 RepID=A0A7Y0DVJ8_9GAMM|nr:glycosyltransferase family 2 protein [Pseudoalteromonas arctica]NMM42418.1 glycosyltransferase family 2 protein [Pseudoalteromonas arctica]